MLPTAHIRRIKALRVLGQFKCADLAAFEFKRLFPERVHSEEFQMLLGQLDRGLKQRAKLRERWIEERDESRRRREVGEEESDDQWPHSPSVLCKQEALRSISLGQSTPRPQRSPEATHHGEVEDMGGVASTSVDMGGDGQATGSPSPSVIDTAVLDASRQSIGDSVAGAESSATEASSRDDHSDWDGNEAVGEGRDDDSDTDDDDDDDEDDDNDGDQEERGDEEDPSRCALSMLPMICPPRTMNGP